MLGIPFDNPTTHLELTMIHEAMILEYSGKNLGIMEWASWTKLMVFLTLLANLFFPWGLLQNFKLQRSFWNYCVYYQDFFIGCFSCACRIINLKIKTIQSIKYDRNRIRNSVSGRDFQFNKFMRGE